MINLTFVQWFSLGLLSFRIIAVIFFLMLLGKQLKFMREDDGIQTTRKMLFSLGLILLAQNVVPIIIDLAALFQFYPRTHPAPLGLAYSFSNASFSALAGFTFWLMYRFIERENIRLHKENDKLQVDNDDLHTDNDSLQNRNEGLQTDNDDLHTENDRLNS